MLILRILIPILIFGAIDLYGFQGLRTLIRRSKWSSVQPLAVGFYWGSTLLVIITIVVGIIMLPSTRLKGDGGAVYISIMAGMMIPVYVTKLVLALFVLVDDVRRAGVWGYRKLLSRNQQTDNQSLMAQKDTEATADTANDADATDGISRSEFLAKAGLIAASVPFISFVRGITNGRYNYQVMERSIPIKGLPMAFDGFRILQLSDFHTGSFDNKDAVAQGIRLAIKQKPDLMLFTGDMVNNIASELHGWMDIYAELDAPHGKFSILGNHDYGDYISEWEVPNGREKNLQQLLDYQRQMDFHMLMDEHMYLEKAGQRLALVGIQNWGRKPFPQYGDLDKASAGLSKDEPKLLLSHDPTSFDDLIVPHEKDFHLTMSGHTHGMQFGIETGDFRWSPVQLRYDRWADHYHVGHQHLYVNRGYGFLGFPGRVGILPEISILTLQRA